MAEVSLLDTFLAASGVSTDTRTLRSGELFFALRGPSFDGNAYAQAALAAGAAAAVVDDVGLAQTPQCIYVDDALAALQSLARDYRRTLNFPVVALTGSNGKTTTKELIAAVLGRSYQVTATQGNLNNHIGVPLTLLRIPRDAEVAVVEMGANHVGEIATLATIAEPTHGLITNIGRAHLEGFGGIEGVRQGKGELFDWLAAHGGIAFVDLDNDEVERLSSRCPRRLLYRSRATAHREPGVVLAGQLRAAFPHAAGELIAGDRAVDFVSQLPGEHNFANLITAATVGHYFKVPLREIAEALAEYRPDNSRSEERRVGRTTLLLDAYNANPDSTLAGLRWLASRPESRKVAVLGTLAEMGAYAKTVHAEIAKASKEIDGAEVLYFGASWDGAAAKEQVYTDWDTLRERVAAYWDREDTVVLIKGSRSNRLERLLPVSA